MRDGEVEVTESGSLNAGWYSDPRDPAHSLRYWNGVGWTQSTMQLAGQDVEDSGPTAVPTRPFDLSIPSNTGGVPTAASELPPDRLIARRVRTSERVGEVLTFFALLTLLIGVIAGGSLFLWSCNEMGSRDPAVGADQGVWLGIAIGVGSLLQYAILRLGSVVAFFIRDRYLGYVS